MLSFHVFSLALLTVHSLAVPRASAAVFSPLYGPRVSCPTELVGLTSDQEKRWEEAGFKRSGENFWVKDSFLVRVRGGEGLTLYHAPYWTSSSFYNGGPRELYAVVTIDLAARPASLRWPDQIGFLFRPSGKKGPISGYYPTPSGSGGVNTEINPEMRIVGDLDQQLEHVGFVPVSDGYYERASRQPEPEHRQNWLLKVEGGLVTHVYAAYRPGVQQVLRDEGLLAIQTNFDGGALLLTTKGAYSADLRHPYFTDKWLGNHRFALISAFDPSWKPFHWQSTRLTGWLCPKKAEDPMTSATVASRFGRWQASVSSDGSLTVMVDADAGNERLVEMLLTASQGDHVTGGELTTSDSATGTKLVLSGIRENPQSGGTGHLAYLSLLREVLGEGPSTDRSLAPNAGTVQSSELAGRKLAPATGSFGERTVGMVSRTSTENVALPTAALYSALSMTLTGARGNTHTELASAMAAQGLAEVQWLPANRWLREQLADGSGLTMSSSVWVNSLDGQGLDTHYKNQVKAAFAAPATALPFNESTRARINTLVEENTGGRIKEFLPQLQSSQVFLLLSAMRFQGKWKQAFDKERTREGKFYGAGRVMMMQKDLSGEEGILGFDDGVHFGARLPLADGRYVIDLYSTDDPAASEDFLKGLDGHQLGELAHQMGPMGEGKLLLPRIKVNWKADLIPVLSAMGVKDLFSSGTANLIGMSSGSLFVDLILAAGELEWDEIGVEAAGAAAVGGSRGLSRDLNFDRPFVVDIRRTDNGASVFHAGVRKP